MHVSATAMLEAEALLRLVSTVETCMHTNLIAIGIRQQK
jgi:hypothetical protein